MSVKVKICGITNSEDADAAVEAGADAIGFNFYRLSPRFIEPAAARNIIEALPPFVSVVGVFVNEPEPARVIEIADILKLDAIQLHGDESPEYCAQLSDWKVIKAFRVRNEAVIARISRYDINAVLLDGYSDRAFGGTGERFDWQLARQAKKHCRVILAGGLTCENVADAIIAVKPYAVDVASGVEIRSGKKDHDLIKRFIKEVRKSDYESNGE